MISIRYFCVMQLFKKIVDFYIFSNIHVALAGFSMTKITLVNFGIEENLAPLFVAFSILISYNFIRFYEIKNNRLNWFKDWFFLNLKEILLLMILSVLGLGYISFFADFNLKSVLILFPFAFMTFFYAIPLFKIGKLEVSFRNFPMIKIFSIAIAWAGISVFFPLYEANYQFTSAVYLEFFQRILILLAITIPFDIRDVNVDLRSLKTLPQILGITNSKVLGTLLLLGFPLIEIVKENFTYFGFLILMIISIISILFLWFSSPKRSRYYTSFWVESVPVIWLGLFIFIKL
ncbi:MAG: UbiA prenyltransferase family protein [Lutibacter sp.]